MKPKRIISSILLLLCSCVFMSAQTSIKGVLQDSLNYALYDLDKRIANRETYIKKRQAHIDSLKIKLSASVNDGERLKQIMDIAMAYTSFDTDSALLYYTRGIDLAPEGRQNIFLMRRAAILPLVGLNEQAVKTFEAINPDNLNDEQKRIYYDCARQAYTYIAGFYHNNKEIHETYSKKALDAQRKLIELLPHESKQYKLNMGEYFCLTGESAKGMALLDELMESEPQKSNIRARAAHILSNIARTGGNDNLWMYYLVQSAISDISTATLEVASLQDLGINLYKQGDIDRAYNYLLVALENAVRCKASTRMIESAQALPVIEHAYNDKIQVWVKRVYIVIAILAFLALLLAGSLFYLRHEMKKMAALQKRLAAANEVKEIYISRFLSLCSIYMDKLNQLTKIVERKISSGHADELLRMTRSGKFVEEQSKEFYEVFDDAFLHLFPTFVDDVNRLLQPDQQLVLKKGEILNTDLRILAFMRLGIEDSARISQVLNYSLNTIYTYRNKLKNRAINRDTFEHDVMLIGKESENLDKQ